MANLAAFAYLVSGILFIMALRRIGPAAVPALTEALKDSDPKVRSSAAEILAEIMPPAQTKTPHRQLPDFTHLFIAAIAILCFGIWICVAAWRRASSATYPWNEYRTKFAVIVFALFLVFGISFVLFVLITTTLIGDGIH